MLHFPRSKPALLMTAACAAMAVGWMADGTLPARGRLAPALTGEPLQTPTAQAPFAVSAGGVRYQIKPVFDYDISGLVVSLHHSDTWWDWIHAASNDHLNVVDLCVVWGANAKAGAYKKMKFSSGQFVCYVSTSDPIAWQTQYVRALSNNHLLTDSPRIARQLSGLRVGDQIRLRGQLAEYSHHAGFAFTRGTSTTRDDTGNGACETIFVQDVTVLRPANGWPRWLLRAGALLLAFGLWRWFVAPHRARDEDRP